MNLPDIMLTKNCRHTTIQKKCKQMVSAEDTIGKALILHGEPFCVEISYWIIWISGPSLNSIDNYISSREPALWRFASLQVSFNFWMPIIIWFIYRPSCQGTSWWHSSKCLHWWSHPLIAEGFTGLPPNQSSMCCLCKIIKWVIYDLDKFNLLFLMIYATYTSLLYWPW